MITLDQIEQLMNRTGSDYETVRDALRATEGDMFKALLLVEQAQENGEPIDYKAYRAANTSEDTFNQGTTEETAQQNKTAASAQAILDTLRDILKRFNASSIMIKKDDNVVLNLSATIGTIGLIIAPVASIIGLGAALVTDYQIIVILDDGKEININETAKSHMNNINNFAKNEYDNVKAGFNAYNERTRAQRENRKKDAQVAEEEGYTATYETESHESVTSEEVPTPESTKDTPPEL